MGKEDLLVRDYFNDIIHFADLFNGILFEGKSVIEPESLGEVDKSIISVINGVNRETQRDNVKCWNNQTYLRILVAESQHGVDYHMVIRAMNAETPCRK